MRIRWEDGVVVEAEETKIVFDPQSKRLNCKAVFITHAHVDHSHAFKIKHTPKFSSEETMRLATINGAEASNWQPLPLNEKIVLNDMEIKPHSSGHVLGSYEFEVSTPDGTVLFTGDMNTREFRIIKPAEPVSCDVLIIESTFGSPDFIFPPDDIVAKSMVDWAIRTLREGKIPVFRADSLGNAQEVIRIFNENTDLPVVSHSRVTKISRIYEAYGYKMEYVDMGSRDVDDLISNRNAVIVAPKNLDLSSYSPEYVSALVSGWALKFKRNSFPLSDHADFPNLIRFVGDCNPKLVLTYHGGRFNSILAKYIEKKLKIRSYPIDLITTSFRRQ
ncbi:MAG: MBL fold metallo-hydrolase [Candidatus Bathyarchaeota archaeon]|nr:MBL fold metallo-hydrolase [Candidatus Bathyarchaeota archaeon]